MSGKNKKTDELKDKDLDKVQGGLIAQIDGIKKPLGKDGDPGVMGKGPNPPQHKAG